MTTIAYFIQETLAYLRGDRGTLTMTTLTFSFTMLIFGIFLLIYLNVSTVMDNLRSEIRILLYLKDGVSGSDVAELRGRLESVRGVSKVKYVSKDDALEDFTRSVEGGEMLLKGLGENPLPASFEVSVDSPHRSSAAMAGLADQMRDLPGVEQIQYGKEWVENIENWLWYFRAAAGGVGVLLAFTLTAIVANTIQLTVLLRKNEVEILRLMGATRGFVCGPFILEGAFIGLSASGIALLLLGVLYHLGSRNFFTPGGGFIPAVGISFLPPLWMLGFLATGFFLGTLGSYWPFRRWS